MKILYSLRRFYPVETLFNGTLALGVVIKKLQVSPGGQVMPGSSTYLVNYLVLT
jgi:hypothetical protein